MSFLPLLPVHISAGILDTYRAPRHCSFAVFSRRALCVENGR